MLSEHQKDVQAKLELNEQRSLMLLKIMQVTDELATIDQQIQQYMIFLFQSIFLSLSLVDYYLTAVRLRIFIAELYHHYLMKSINNKARLQHEVLILSITSMVDVFHFANLLTTIIH